MEDKQAGPIAQDERSNDCCISLAVKRPDGMSNIHERSLLSGGIAY